MGGCPTAQSIARRSVAGGRNPRSIDRVNGHRSSSTVLQRRTLSWVGRGKGEHSSPDTMERGEKTQTTSNRRIRGMTIRNGLGRGPSGTVGRNTSQPLATQHGRPRGTGPAGWLAKKKLLNESGRENPTWRKAENRNHAMPSLAVLRCASPPPPQSFWGPGPGEEAVDGGVWGGRRGTLRGRGHSPGRRGGGTLHSGGRGRPGARGRGGGG